MNEKWPTNEAEWAAWEAEVQRMIDWWKGGTLDIVDLEAHFLDLLSVVEP